MGAVDSSASSCFYVRAIHSTDQPGFCVNSFSFSYLRSCQCLQWRIFMARTFLFLVSGKLSESRHHSIFLVWHLALCTTRYHWKRRWKFFLYSRSHRSWVMLVGNNLPVAQYFLEHHFAYPGWLVGHWCFATDKPTMTLFLPRKNIRVWNRYRFFCSLSFHVQPAFAR